MRIHSILVFLVLIAGAFLIQSCSLDYENIGAPAWTIEATVPFSERTYTMAELALTDSEAYAEQGWGILENESDGVLRFEFIEQLERQEVGERLTYNSSDTGRYTNEIGVIQIEKPDPDSNAVYVNDVNPNLEPGYNGPIPPFEFPQLQENLEFNIFHWVAVRDGKMFITLENHFPFDLEDISLTMENNTGELLGSADFGGQTIASESSAVDSIDLSGKFVRNEILMNIEGRSPGAGADLVEITGEEHMLTIIQISETEVDSASAEIAEQSFSEDDQISWEDENKISEAKIKTGNAYFRFKNTTESKLFIDMVFEDVTNENGDALSLPIELDPEQWTDVQAVDLTDYSITMPLDEQRVMVNNQVTVEDSRITRHNGTPYQTIAGYQGVEIEYWIGDLILSELSGVLDKIEIDFPEQTTSIDIPQGLDNIHFTRDTVFIKIIGESAIPLKLDLNLVAKNSSNNETDTLVVSKNVFPGDTTTIRVPDADRLSDILPDTITASGWIGLGVHYFPGYTDLMHISEDNGFEGRVRIKSSLKFTAETTTFFSDPVEIEDEIDQPVEDVLLRVRLANNIPIAGKVDLMMGNDVQDMDTILSIAIPQSPIVNYRTSLAETTLAFFLDSTALDIFRRTPFFTQQAITLHGTNGDTVHIHGDDSLLVRAAATVHFEIDPEGEEE